MAVEDGIPWLMLLDQDTRVTAEYLHELMALQPIAAQDPKIAAFAPKLAGITGLRSPASTSSILCGARSCCHTGAGL